jgi:membrane protein YqaA with SNARE-associated domain
MRLLAGLVTVAVLVALLGHAARAPAEAAARLFVQKLGIWGLALGTFLADGLYFPVPPQFYMLLALAAHTRTSSALVAICIASLLAGAVGYRLAALAARSRWFEKKTKKERELLSAAYERYGYRAALIASLLPIPYSMLCYAAGLSGLPLRFVGLLSLCRIPKLLGFWWLIALGWRLG